jgi:hypothetical protein
MTAAELATTLQNIEDLFKAGVIGRRERQARMALAMADWRASRV